MKVVLVDDHQLFRDGLKLLLNNAENIEVTGEASSGKEFLDELDHYKDAIVLMDIKMPDIDGIEATKKALEKHHDIKIIALSMYGDQEYYYKMIEAGVKGFLLKNSGIDEVIEAIELVDQGENFFHRICFMNLSRTCGIRR